MALKHFKNATPSTSVVNESLPWQSRSKPNRLGIRTGFRHHPNVANHRRALKIDEARSLIQWRSFFNSSREVGCYIFFWGMSEVFCLFSIMKWSIQSKHRSERWDSLCAKPEPSVKVENMHVTTHHSHLPKIKEYWPMKTLLSLQNAGGSDLVVLQKDRNSVSFHGVATDQALLDAISHSVIQQYEGWDKG